MNGDGTVLDPAGETKLVPGTLSLLQSCWRFKILIDTCWTFNAHNSGLRSLPELKIELPGSLQCARGREIGLRP